MSSVAVAIAADHPAFDGHFPGQPLLPGVALLAEVMEAALRDPDLASFIGTAPRLASAKFLAPVRPGDALVVSLVRQGDRLVFDVRRDSRSVASGQFARAAVSTAPETATAMANDFAPATATGTATDTGTGTGRA